MQGTIALFEERLKPCGERDGTAELLACLTLVAPSGMNAEDRKAWVAIARKTLTGIPADLLKRGCDKARRTCRLAADIVPTIEAEVRATWDHRKRLLEEAKGEASQAPRIGGRRPFNHIPHEETQAIIREAFSGKRVGDGEQ